MQIAEETGLSDGTKRISIILPVFNEKPRIYEMVRATSRVMVEFGSVYEIILVDDGSNDGTAAEITRAVADFDNVVRVDLPENRGKGNALRRGFYASSGGLVCFLDADLDLHPSQVRRLAETMDRSGADMVIGSKRHPDSRLDYPLHRRLFSTAYYFMIHLLVSLPVKDTQTGIKLFRREVLADIFPRLICKQYALDMELLAVAHRMGFSVAEAPVELTFQGKFGRIKWSDIRNIMVDTMAIFFRLRLLKYYDSPLKPVIEREPSVSIVIPTRGLDDFTGECLRRCEEMDYGNYDIQLMPDEPVDEGGLPPRTEVLPSGSVGPSVKRNMGVQASNAEIIAFIDSDAWPDPQWLRNAVPYFEDENIAAVGGPAVTPPHDSMLQQAGGMVYSSSIVSGNTTYRYTYHAMREVDDYPTCNLLVRKSYLDGGCTFPREFWPGEDTVLCLRLTKEMGKRIVYVPNVVVYHHRRPLLLPHIKQVYSYAVHRGFFARKFPETSRRLQYFVPSLFVFWLVAGLALGLFFRPVLYLYLAVLGLYLVLCLFSSIKSLEPLVNLLVFPGIIATNITYGVGFMRGLLSRRMKEQ